MSQIVQIPNDWEPRIHQAKIWNYILEGGKRAALVWHRRAGKDSVSLNLTASVIFQRTAVYWHMLPTTVQARKVIWNGIDKEGRRMIDQAFPRELRTRTNNQEMLIETINGSIWQLCGSDNYDSLVGSNPAGVIFSEYSLADPAAWDYIRPILVENGGWAIFIYTPRGKNHGYHLAQMAEKNPKWFYEKLTVDQTWRNDGTPIVPRWAVEEELESGMPEEKVLQEFYCSWEAGMEGALYTKELAYADKRGLHAEHLWMPDRLCISVWDIGRDMTVGGIFQMNDNNVPVLIDALHGRNKGLPHWAKELKDKPYVYADHFWPHDMGVTEWGTDKLRIETAEKLGVGGTVMEKRSLEDGMDAARIFLRRCYINTGSEGAQYVLDGLASYKRKWDEKKKIWMDQPDHDWASHPSDMMRYAALELNEDMFGGYATDKFKVIRAHQ